jgi:CO/xanthine dehydrogenase FAD-binding subunit
MKRYIFPETVDECLQLLKEEPSVKIVAGGTSLIYAGLNRQPLVLIDITRLPLDYVKEDTEFLRIGATTTVQTICQTPASREFCAGLLAQACRKIGDQQIRNLVTVGGNVAKPYVWSDLPAVLLTLDAQITIVGEETRTVTAVDFFQERIQPTEIVTEIALPVERKNGKGVFRKISRTSVDYALFNLSGSTIDQTANFTDIRVSVSGLTKKPQRLPAVEQALSGKAYKRELVTKMAAKAAQDIGISPTYKAGTEYLRELFRLKLEETLEELR